MKYILSIFRFHIRDRDGSHDQCTNGCWEWIRSSGVRVSGHIFRISIKFPWLYDYCNYTCKYIELFPHCYIAWENNLKCAISRRMSPFNIITTSSPASHSHSILQSVQLHIVSFFLFSISELIVQRIIRPWYHYEFIFKHSELYKKSEETLSVLHNFTRTVRNDKGWWWRSYYPSIF